MGYVLLMTLSGSTLFLGYLCWEKILDKSITQSMRYRALTLVMLAYAIPWVWLKGIYRQIIGLFLVEKVDAGAKGLVSVADIETKEIAYQTKEYRLLTVIMSIWFTIAVTLLIIRIVRYLVRRHALHALAIKCEDENLEQTVKRLKETIRYRQGTEIVWTRVNNETFTLGAIKPIIFLQKNNVEGDIYWILKHEMTHIVRMDLWVKLLMEFVCCLYWFNPLIYLLEHRMTYLCETSCDEKVIESCTEEECQLYMNLLERNKGVNKLKIPFSSVLESGEEIDKRIALIKKRANIKYREKTIAICLFGVLVFLNSLIALAYPEVHHVKSDVTNVAEDAVDGNNFWIFDYVEDGYDMPMEVVLYDGQFIDKIGQIYAIDTTDKQKVCLEHDVVSGIVQIHEKDNDGGCILESYEGTRCTKCGYVWKDDLLSKIRKIPCPH